MLSSGFPNRGRRQPSFLARGWKAAGSLQKGLKHFSTLVFLLLLAATCTGKDGPLGQVTRLLTAIANVGDSAGRAASVLLDTGTDVTAVASNALLAITTTTLNAAETAWRGVDLREVNGERTVGRVILDDGDVMTRWLKTPAGKMATRCNITKVHEMWSSLASSVGFSMPLLETNTENLIPESTYWRASGRAISLVSGHISVEYTFLYVSFAPSWANPLWAALEIDVSKERQQILALLTAFANTLPTMNTSFSALQTADADMVIQKAWAAVLLKQWARSMALRASLFVHWIGSRRGLGTLIFMAGMGFFLRGSSRARQFALRLLNGVNSFLKAHFEWIWDYGFTIISATE